MCASGYIQRRLLEVCVCKHYYGQPLSYWRFALHEVCVPGEMCLPLCKSGHVYTSVQWLAAASKNVRGGGAGVHMGILDPLNYIDYLVCDII